MDLAQSEVSALLDRQADAMRTKAIDQLMSLYSPDVAYFDTVPPLQYAGSAALRERFLEWFDGWEGLFEVEIRDLHVVASGDIAVAYRFSRACGTLKNGQKAESWVRATSCCQRSNQRWLITHEHVSWPVDVKSGRAAMDLRPQQRSSVMASDVMGDHLETTRATTEVVNRFIDAFQNKDASAIPHLVAEDCVMEAMQPAPNGERVEGYDANVRFWRAMVSDPVGAFEVEEVAVFGDRAINRWRYRFGEGDDHSVRGVTLIKVRGNKIVEALAYAKTSTQSDLGQNRE